MVMFTRIVVFQMFFFFSMSSVSAENVDEKDEVMEVFFEYLDAYSSSEFYAATRFFHPRHLNDYEEYVLPVLVDARNDARGGSHPILKDFFEGGPEGSAGEMSGAQVSANLDRAMTNYFPAIIESTRLENISIKSVALLGDGRARVEYDYLTPNGETTSLEESFARYNGEWRILLPVPPLEAADELRRLFQ